MGPPTLTGFGWFITNIMGIDPLILPSSSPVIGYSFDIAMETVNRALCQLGDLYTRAVYNLGGATLLAIAPDQSGRTFFEDKRALLDLNKFTPGLIASTSDATSAISFVSPEWTKNLTIGELQLTKTIYGRTYLDIAQAYGPTIVGMS